MRRRWRYMVIAWLVLGAVVAAVPGAAANAFAAPAFEARWRADEAIARDFWGPLGTAPEAINEQYGGGTRLVQYFDKGRMELAPDGTVTSGPLAAEMLTGIVETGPETFESLAPPRLSVTGRGRITYASLGEFKPLTARATSRIGEGRLPFMAPSSYNSPRMPRTNYELSQREPPTGPETIIAAYDDATGHNVPDIFAAYRDRLGMAAVGATLTEPFWAEEGTNGAYRLVLTQVFGRRVFVYYPDATPENRVRMVPVGRQHYDWRYGKRSNTADFNGALTAIRNRTGNAALPQSCIYSADYYGEKVAGAAVQRFERGTMLYLPSENAFYALVEPHGGKLFAVPRTFGDGDLTVGLAPGPTPGTFVPRLGFGVVWAENPEIQQALGYATGDEQRYTSTTCTQKIDYTKEPMDNLMVTDEVNGYIYLLDRQAGTWERALR